MITAQLWIGVVFLILMGFLSAHNLQRFVRGRYRAEFLTAGAAKGLLGLIRWCWAIIFALSTVFFFVAALWLARYALSH